MFVKQLRYCYALSLMILFLQLPVAHGQVFPGDADNNGIVNHLDVLNVGYAFGSTGPARLESGGQPATQGISATWDDFFPQGLNFAFADADGNGWVNYLDLAIVSSNYGEINPNGSEDISFFPGVPETHVPLILDKSEVPDFPTGGSIIEIPIILGSEDMPLEFFQGIAFTIDYDADYIAGLEFNFDDNSWVNAGVGSLGFVGPETEIGKKEIALSRKGANPVDGQGKIGTLSLIVIDDLGTLLASPTDSSNVIINIINIKAVNGDFWVVPIVSDSVSVMVYGPDALPLNTDDPVLNAVKVYPNPATNHLKIESPILIQEVVLLGISGTPVLSINYEEARNIEINLEDDLPGGYYLLRIKTDKGILMRKIMVARQ